jgi:hypothetical protein
MNPTRNQHRKPNPLWPYCACCAGLTRQYLLPLPSTRQKFEEPTFQPAIDPHSQVGPAVCLKTRQILRDIQLMAAPQAQANLLFRACLLPHPVMYTCMCSCWRPACAQTLSLHMSCCTVPPKSSPANGNWRSEWPRLQSSRWGGCLGGIRQQRQWSGRLPGPQGLQGRLVWKLCMQLWVLQPSCLRQHDA